ncbi:hypothetical protein LXL04_022956 [Taraxacum kok-saghyz]
MKRVKRVEGKQGPDGAGVAGKPSRCHLRCTRWRTQLRTSSSGLLHSFVAGKPSRCGAEKFNRVEKKPIPKKPSSVTSGFQSDFDFDFISVRKHVESTSNKMLQPGIDDAHKLLDEMLQFLIPFCFDSKL